MLGVLFAFVGSLLEEISSSIGKFAFARGWERPATMGLLNSAWTVIYFGIISVAVPGSFVIATSSLPILGILVILGGMQSIASLVAIKRASRSTYGLLRTTTIPILALIDALTGRDISPVKFLAMGLMYAAVVWLNRNHGIEKRGAGIVLFTAVNGAVCLALLKYLFETGTSIPAAQIVILVPTIVALAVWYLRERKPAAHGKTHYELLTVQTAAAGAATLVQSYALLFVPASVMTAVVRSCAVLFSMLSGNAVFHERHIKEKIIAGGVIVIGLAMLVMG